MKALAIFLAGGIGFLSLSQEILWVRLVSFALTGKPQAFSLVLGVFLFGIAIGAEAGKRICQQNRDLVTASALALLLAASVDALIILCRTMWFDVTLTWSVVPLLIIASAACKSALFPIVHHLGSSTSSRGLGVSISTVYFSNIIGSTLGPLVTGFFLLDHVGLKESFSIIVQGDLILASICFFVARRRTAAIVTVITISILSAWPSPESSLVPAKQIIENRHGIIHVLEGGKNGDIILGGNIYDGRINTSLRNNSNLVNRVYILAALHPAPKSILVIGLSGGSWTKILSGVHGVERIDVVEINPGYLKIISNYAEVADILGDQRIHIYIDDGRRWLKRNPQNKYDLIVMNTTFHWRSYATNLLAIEFLRTLRTRMNPNAILAFNTTGSMDAFKTATAVFRHNYLYGNFVLSGDTDFHSNLTTGFNRIAMMAWGNHSIFRINDEQDVESICRALSIPFVTFSDIQRVSPRQYEVITEQNMITEFKYRLE